MVPARRKIAVVTTSRADYNHLYWVLRELVAQDGVDLKVIALGPHLSPEFGCTVMQIERDGFVVNARIESLLSSDTDIGMAKSIGLATLSLSDCLGQMRPDLLVLIADRYEMLAPASVALALRIPIAHIEGGEISEGAIDDAVRNALTKLSHIHFTSTPAARSRVIAMGEEEWRVHCSGAPSLDHICRNNLPSREQVEEKLRVNLNQPFILVVYHPTTIARDTTREADAFFEALCAIPDRLFFSYPNADAGSRFIIQRAERFVESRANGRLFVNLGPEDYWVFLRDATLLLGNSSSGIMEAASFAVPAVNVGIRQRGREHGRNVLDAEASPGCIVKQIQIAKSPEFRQTLIGMENPYGDGHAAERITGVLTSTALDERLLIKKALNSQR